MRRGSRSPLPFRRMIFTSNFMSSVSQFPHLSIYNSIFLPVPNHLSIRLNKHVRLRFEYSLNKPFRAAPLQPIYLSSSPWTLKQPTIPFHLMEIPPANNTSYIRHIRCQLDEYPSHTLRLSRRLKIEIQIGLCLSLIHISEPTRPY